MNSCYIPLSEGGNLCICSLTAPLSGGVKFPVPPSGTVIPVSTVTTQLQSTLVLVQEYYMSDGYVAMDAVIFREGSASGTVAARMVSTTSKNTVYCVPLFGPVFRSSAVSSEARSATSIDTTQFPTELAHILATAEQEDWIHDIEVEQRIVDHILSIPRERDQLEKARDQLLEMILAYNHKRDLSHPERRAYMTYAWSRLDDALHSWPSICVNVC